MPRERSPQTTVGRREPAAAPRAAAALAAVVLGLVALAGPASPQSPAKVARIGYLAPTSQPEREAVFRRALQQLGYTEGQNVTLEHRSADGQFERLPGLAAELVALNVDVIVAVVTQAALAAKRATGTIPIVMVAVADPVGTGLVATLARPGGNVTGTSSEAADVVGKQLELLREMLPRVNRVAVLSNPSNTVFQKRQLAEARAAAAKLGLQMHSVEARAADALDGALAAVARQKADALFVLGDPLFNAHFARIAGFALKHQLPTVSAARQNAEAGALMTYGPNFLEAHARAAAYVDRILRGSRPADLPVEQGTTFELVVNARTAKALGLAIPPALALRVDHVIQ